MVRDTDFRRHIHSVLRRCGVGPAFAKAFSAERLHRPKKSFKKIKEWS
jgi:hypothetical protein